MKKLIYFLCFSLTFLVFNSCVDGQESKQEILEKIAKDQVFVDYQKLVNKLQIDIASKKFDIRPIHEELIKHVNYGFCDIPTSLVSKYKGGEEYLQLNCNMDNAKNALTKKYPDFSNFTREEYKKIREISAEAGLLATEKEMIETISSEIKSKQ
jgi:hypothetical protein